MRPDHRRLCCMLAAFALALAFLPAIAAAQPQDFPPMHMGGGEARASAGILGCGCVVILAMVIACWVVFIAIAVYVYRDAEARGMENPVLWLLLVILTGLIGLIIYLIVRPPKR